MARIKVVPRKSSSWALTPRPHTPSSAITIHNASSIPQELPTRPTSTTKNDVERKNKGKKYALQRPTKEDEEETETEEEEEDDPHAKLIDELKFFQQWGLMNKQEPNKVSSSDDDNEEEEAPSETPHFGVPEVTRRYPNFFLLIPQYPHYRGLLHDGVDEGIKKTVYQALWCKLVDLMDKALQTNCLSNPREIKEMMEEARGLEKLGFDVRHLMARLELPSRSIFDLRLANDQLRLAKKRKREVEEQLTELDMLEAEADRLRKMLLDVEAKVSWLRKMLLDVEAKVSRLKAKVGSNEERAALMKSLRKEVEDAEKSFRAKLDMFKSLD
ncbi:stress response protein NST1-like [Cocos nucifera]|uniref:Stress response protein NST1-like n=1 Tax=Cocos nucifera TaxID=13894 RepID=A0A8K0IH33_COCNU|nr:stress response protein NST1-like [Cocos nucifera]